MYTAKIVNVTRDVFHATQEPFLSVEVEIIDPNGKAVETRKFGYSADASKKEIKADVEKLLETFHLEIEQAAKNKAMDEANAKIDATISAIMTDEIFSAPVSTGKKKSKKSAK